MFEKKSGEGLTEIGEMASAVQSISCSWRGPEFISKPAGGSQPSITPIPEDPMPPFSLLGHQAYMWCTYRHDVKTHIYIKFKTTKH